MKERLERLLFLEPGELGRTLPFFGFYLLLFGAFTVADGLSLSLFVRRVGAALPLYYGITATSNVVLIGGYVLVAERLGGRRMFGLILGGCALIYAAVWFAVRSRQAADWEYGVLFVTREIGYTLVLMHFGTYLQDYFTRDELNRVLPVVYAGGRVGGIAGGAALEWCSRLLGTINLALLFVALCLLCLVCLSVIKRTMPRVAARTDNRSSPEAAAEGAEPGLEQQASSSLGAFLRFVWASPLLFWLTVTGVLFMVIRWFLNYQYNAFFGRYFHDSASMAEFLGLYTQLALVLSLVIQLLVVNRLVNWLGPARAYLAYSVLVLIAVLLCLLPMTLALAVFCRLVETELRFGLRNPITQLLTNQFSRSLRIRVRAWTMGLLTPTGTLAASLLLGTLELTGLLGWVGWVGGGLGVVHFLSSLALCGTFREEPRRQDEKIDAGRDPCSPSLSKPLLSMTHESRKG